MAPRPGGPWQLRKTWIFYSFRPLAAPNRAAPGPENLSAEQEARVPVLDIGHRISSLKRGSEGSARASGRVKINPLTGEIIEAVIASRAIFARGKGWEPVERKESGPGERREAGSDSLARSAARARRRVFELCACNELDLFFTLTLSPEKADRWNYKEAVEKARAYFSNRVQRKGLIYVAVPELHKNGAVHFHGLCNCEGVGLYDSGRKWKGRQVFNLDWKLGFSTGVRIEGERPRVARYIAKYVTKQQGGGTIGGRYYFHGGALRDPVCRCFDPLPGDWEGHRVEVEGARLSLLYLDLKAPSTAELLSRSLL